MSGCTKAIRVAEISSRPAASASSHAFARAASWEAAASRGPRSASRAAAAINSAVRAAGESAAIRAPKSFAPAPRGRRAEQRLATGPLAFAECAGGLDQGERIALRIVQETRGYIHRQPRDGLVKQSGGVGRGERSQRELLEAGRRQRRGVRT